MTGSLLEPLADLRRLVQSVAHQCLPIPKYSYSTEFLIESIAAELHTTEAAVATPSAQSFAAKFSELILDYYTADMDDVDDFAAKLHAGLEQAREQMKTRQEADDPFGGCAMCERDMPLTKHHLIPRETHKGLKKKGAGAEQLGCAINICRPCHSAIHRTLTNKELASKYNSLEKLMEVDALKNFAGWASKQQSVRASDVVDVAHYRYRR